MPRSCQFSSCIAFQGDTISATTVVIGARRPLLAYSTDFWVSSSLVYLEVSGLIMAWYLSCQSFFMKGANVVHSSAFHSSYLPMMSTKAFHISRRSPPRNTPPSFVG